jgi:hypothetical protein
VRWSFGPVVYLGLNVQGSNDNYPYAGVDGETRSASEIDRQRAEERARKAANLEWLHEGFDYAKEVGAKGVMVIWQADPNFNNDQHLADTRSWDAYPDYVNGLRTESLAFAGQVALVHGDGHYFKLDKPLNGPADGVLPTSRAWRRSERGIRTGSAQRSIRTIPTSSSSSLGSCPATRAER